MSLKEKIGEEKYEIVRRAMELNTNGQDELEAINEALKIEELGDFDRGYLEHKKRMILATGKGINQIMDDFRNSL